MSVLVADAVFQRFHAALAFLELGDDMRMLPGMVALALPDGTPFPGPLLQLQRDEKNRVWAIAPWAGRIVKITLP